VDFPFHSSHQKPSHRREAARSAISGNTYLLIFRVPMTTPQLVPFRSGSSSAAKFRPKKDSPLAADAVVTGLCFKFHGWARPDVSGALMGRCPETAPRRIAPAKKMLTRSGGAGDKAGQEIRNAEGSALGIRYLLEGPPPFFHWRRRTPPDFEELAQIAMSAPLANRPGRNGREHFAARECSQIPSAELLSPQLAKIYFVA